MNNDKYEVYIFKENDRINLIFDRYKLIDVLTRLYERIGVVNRINTSHTVNENEKHIILSIIGDNTNIQYNEKDKNDNTVNHIHDLINATKVISSISSKLRTECNSTKTKSSNADTLYDVFSRRVFEFKNSVGNNEQTPLTQYFETALKKSDNQTEELDGFNDNDDKYCYLMNEVLKEFDEKQKKSYYVLYNTAYEAVLICEKNKLIAQCVKEFNEFKLIREYDDLLETTYNKINEYFSKDIYCTEEMLVKKLDAFESLYEISQKCPLEKEKRLILYYINSNYHISNNIDKRIKVSVLQDIVQKELRIHDNNLKYRFASILSEIGLQKKRYSDGMYIYGIEPKSETKVVNKEEIRHLSIDNIVEQRKKELEEIKTLKV